MYMGNSISIPVRSAQIPLQGLLAIPPNAEQLVIFSHGSGSGRNSPRNQYVAEVLNNEGIATLLVDLLTPEEEEIESNRFDIHLLCDRLIGIALSVAHNERLRDLRIAFFGASTGAASALMAAVRLNSLVHAVVSRGGRPDLAGAYLDHVRVPTLLIVGSEDEQVLALNASAYELMKCEKDLQIIPGATHLFEEEGALEAVAALAKDWFLAHTK